MHQTTEMEKSIKQKMIKLKAEIDKFTIIVVDLNISFSVIQRTREKLSQGIKELNNIISRI